MANNPSNLISRLRAALQDLIYEATPMKENKHICCVLSSSIDRARVLLDSPDETTVPLAAYEAAVEGRRDFRAAYRTCRTLLQDFVDAWEGKPGHKNMDRLCELARTNPMATEKASAPAVMTCSGCQRTHPGFDLEKPEKWQRDVEGKWWCNTCTAA